MTAIATLVAVTLPQSAWSQTSRQARIRYVPPTGAGSPRSSQPAATRSPECQDTACLTALVPSNGENPTFIFTAAAHPAFYFLVPALPPEFASLSFILETDDPTPTRLYKGRVLLPSQTGVVRVKVPDFAPALKPGQGYRWSVLTGNDERLVGYVQRVEEDACQKYTLEQAALPLERAALLASRGLWLDAVAELVESEALRRGEPEAVMAWQDLLQSAGLDKLAAFPLLDCCKAQ